MTGRPSWQQVFGLFEEVLDLPGAERTAAVDARCGDDAALRRRVLDMLAAHQESTFFVDRPVALPRVGSADEADQPGQVTGSLSEGLGTVGPYRLLHPIGRGGMSTVYRAERLDGEFRRPMVLKVVRTDLESATLWRRLRAERQILAGLEHPWIARLYDGGSTENGRPFFVMEHVDGEPIDAYCTRRALGVEARLRLFAKVCAAVDHAHQKLIVHLDIKPSNILVTDDGEPKLLDFGIAQAIEPDAGSEATAAWQRMMTPSFASPEQIRGEPITTAADVYSLGVLLYLLLTGRLPHRFDGCSVREIERIITKSRPRPPSRVATGGNDEGASRGTTSWHTAPPSQQTPDDGSGQEPAPVPAQRLRGDLDAIVLRALRPGPLERYRSVASLAEDLERHLDGRPVAARAGTWRYLAGKFMRRHRVAVAAALLFTFVVTGFAVAMGIQTQRVTRERDKKAQVVAMIQQVFTLGDPYNSPDGELTVREAVERSLPLIERGLQDQPAVRAELLQTTGSILASLGEPARAAELLEQALALRLELHGPRHREVAVTRTELARARRELLDLDAAEEQARQALATLRAEADADDGALPEALLTLASIHCYREQFEAAEPLATEVLALTRASIGETRSGTTKARIGALEYLAQAASARGDYQRAADLGRRALDASRELFGDAYPEQITTLSNLGLQLRRLERFDESRAVYDEALALHRQIFGADRADPALLNNLASVTLAAGDVPAAEVLFLEAREAVREHYGAEPWMMLSLGLRLADIRMIRLAPGEAEAQLRDLMAQELVASDHWLQAQTRLLLGESLSRQGRCGEAEPMLESSYRDLVTRNRRARVAADALARLERHRELCPDSQLDLDELEALSAEPEPA
ncbi:MAG: serine/threonine-protein kinase [Acidobacteriota bacterium]